MIKFLLRATCIPILLFGPCVHAKPYFIKEIQQLNKDYLVCNNIYTSTGSLTTYQLCLTSNYDSYDALIKNIREANDFQKKTEWDVINNKINTHNILCKESLERSHNTSIHKEISLCNQLMYRSLAVEALNIR